MAVFVKDQRGWNYEFNSTAGMLARDLRRRGNIVQTAARAQVGVKTGRLRTTITSEVTIDARGLLVKIGSDHKIARLHHDGSRPHVIVPRRASTLRFVQNGRIRYAQRVFHPGTRPNRFLTDNLPKAMY